MCVLCVCQVMAVAVSSDLTVQVLEDVNAAKLADRQQALRAAIQRGEPKCLGVSRGHGSAAGRTSGPDEGMNASPGFFTIH